MRVTSSNARFLRGLARAFGGAILFGLPLLMTMEMWQLGARLPAERLAGMLALLVPVLVLLSWHAGFEPTFSWTNDVADALVAYAVGFAAAAGVLALCGLIDPSMTAREIVGKIALQAMPASMGALLSQSQLGARKARGSRQGRACYASELFIMGVGAVFFALNIAPTQEMLVIALRMPAAGSLALVGVSLAVVHAFVHAVARRDGRRRGLSHVALFARYSVTGYALALLLSAGMLWFFGRLDDMGALAGAKLLVVLALPAAVGAGSARLVL